MLNSPRLPLYLITAAVFALFLTGTGAMGFTGTTIDPGISIDFDLPIQYGVNGIILDEVIIEFESVAQARSAQSVNIIPGVNFDRLMTTRPVARYKILDGANPFETISRLRNMNGIVEIYPNYKRSAALNPNDPYFQLQEEEWLVSQIPAAWDIETGSANVTVAVIDTGVDVTHPDLLPNLILPGINVREDSVPDIVDDDSGHGTAVAGVIGAVGNNGIGVAGLSWNVRILPIRACGGPLLDCDLFDEVEGIDAARLAGVDIINMSIGGVGTISVEKTAVTEAYNAGIVIVAAAGNGGGYYKATGDPDVDKQSLYYPAGLPEVIGVGAVANNGLKAEFSNYGEDILSIMAPGVDIVTTVPDYEVYLYTGEGPPYGLATGTSFATPMVAGAAALLLSHFPGLSPADVRSRLEASAIPMAGPDDNVNGVNDFYGYGILNVAGALDQSGSSGNDYMKIGVTQNPIFPGEILVIIQGLTQLDSSPTINWQLFEIGGGAIITAEEVEGRPGYFIGRFTPDESGTIKITVQGFSGGAPVAPVTVTYTM